MPTLRFLDGCWKLLALGTLAASLSISSLGQSAEPESTIQQTKFEPNWESLSQYRCPEWFRDAKFGIYAHWGPYSAACGTRNTDWYSHYRLIDDLVDIVSKNGCLLLNIAPHPDGTIPVEQQERLREIGRWLRLNGQAIYSTRPWKVYGEGPTKTPQGHLADLHFNGFSAQDVRFTRSKDRRTLYAIALGWPRGGRSVTLKSIKADNLNGQKIKSIQMIGSDDSIEWELDESGLQVAFPEQPPCEHAFVFQIELDAE